MTPLPAITHRENLLRTLDRSKDLAELVGEFGDDLLYWGALGTQTTMPFGRLA